MNETEIFKRLDVLLNIFKDNKRHTKNGLWIQIQIPYPDFTFNELNIYLHKLLDDKHIELENSEIEYRIKFDGVLFIGYENTRILENEQLAKISRTETEMRTYQGKLFWATLSAGIAAALLLIWQVVSYFLPVHPNFVIEILQKKP